MLKIAEKPTDGKVELTLDEIAREGARRMLVEALEAEVTAYLEQHRDARDANDHALVVRNGRARRRGGSAGQ